MAAQPQRHFWHVNESAAIAIGKLAAKSNDPVLRSKEDWCWHAWAAIGAIYYPDHDQTNTGQPTYLIPREAYRGLPPDDPEDQKPDVVVIRFMTIANVLPPIATDRDILWIECKAPDEDVPNRWKQVMNQAVVRLNNAHPNRRVFLILTTGLKWMPFLWDPPNQTAGMQQLNANAPGLAFLMDRQALPTKQDWLCDRRICQIPQNLLPNQAHISPQAIPNGPAAGRLAIDTTRAYSIQFWDNAGQLANVAQLQYLESLFLMIRGQQFNDANPASF